MTVTLEIGGVGKDALKFTVREERAGILNLTVPYAVAVSPGDVFELLTNATTILKGTVNRIRTRRKQKQKIINGFGKTHILYEKYCLHADHHEYEAKDVGWVANDLVDHYFSGVLTSVNVDTTTGVETAAIDFDGKTVGAAFEELARRGDCTFYVDEDDDVHFFVAGAEVSGETLSTFRTLEVIDESLYKAGTIIVRGYIRSIQATAGSGTPERYYQDNRIKTVAEAQEVADVLEVMWSSDQQRVEIVKDEFVNIRAGMTADVDSTDDGFDSETMIVQKMMWAFRPPERCVTTIMLGDAEPSLDEVLAKLSRRDDWEPPITLDYLDDGDYYLRLNKLRGRPDYFGTPRFYKFQGEHDFGYTIVENGGATITVTKDKLVMDSGQVFADECIISTAEQRIDFAKKPTLTIRFKINDVADDTDRNHQFGFMGNDKFAICRVVGADRTLQSMIRETALGGVETQEMAELTAEQYYTVDIFVKPISGDSTGKVEFWLDGVLKTTHTAKVPGDGVADALWALTFMMDPQAFSYTMEISDYEVNQEW